MKAKPLANKNILIGVHGGAGAITEKRYFGERLAECKNVLKEALEKSFSILKSGGTAIEAVELAVIIMEDSGVFNAGRGSVFSHYETQEFDASIMDGSNSQCGAIAGVPSIKNPIKLARLVMEHSAHVLVSGELALNLARDYNLELESKEYFHSDYQYERLKKRWAKEDTKDEKHGTVGAVAMDNSKNLASATSSGGMIDKKYGRIGDSSVIGAGTYANNKTCAVSCTGSGEYFIRNVCAYDISALMEYNKWSLVKSANFVIFDKLENIHGSGGLIALDSDGSFCAPFNTSGMFRANIDVNGMVNIKVFKE